MSNIKSVRYSVSDVEWDNNYYRMVGFPLEATITITFITGIVKEYKGFIKPSAKNISPDDLMKWSQRIKISSDFAKKDEVIVFRKRKFKLFSVYYDPMKCIF